MNVIQDHPFLTLEPPPTGESHAAVLESASVRPAGAIALGERP
ncbi:hypothetical protein [Nonomuraea turkmeniaca]|nr:hypothetical protein [Nonomuraea turkmeniaca]